MESFPHWGYLHDPSKWCTKPIKQYLTPAPNGEHDFEFVENMSETGPRRKRSLKVYVQRQPGIRVSFQIL